MSLGAEYDEIYTGGTAPWEIGAPQPAIAAILGSVRGPRVLDLGCGTGSLALALARRGHDVTGVDVSPVAIAQARTKAADAGLPVRFEVQDATRLSLPPAAFDAIFDSGLLHSLHRAGGTAARDYLAQLPALAAPGASMCVLAVSVEDGQGWGLTAGYLLDAFAAPDWTGTRVEDIEVHAQTDGVPRRLRGLLMRTTRN